MDARIAPAEPPFPAEVQAWLDRTMPPGKPPLRLFTTLARDPRLFGKFFAAGLLDRGHLSLRQREIVIARTTALCRSEYEWGVHIAIFGARVGFTPVQMRSLVHGGPDDDCWTAPEQRAAAPVRRTAPRLRSRRRAVAAAARRLQRRSDAGTADAGRLLPHGQHLTNALRLPLEPDAARFPPPYIDASSIAR